MCKWNENCQYSDSGNTCIDCDYAYIKTEEQLKEYVEYNVND